MKEDQVTNQEAHREAPESLRISHQQRSLPSDKGSLLKFRVKLYTDPLCCWSYAFEGHWNKLIEEFGDEIQCDYVMCGMIPDWQTYNDPMNSVTKPIQMGPVWMHASEVTQVKMKHSLWFDDPPASSYPACIAVKTVELQSAEAAQQYLSLLRSALMKEGKNIAKTEVLFAVAAEVRLPEFDLDRFKNDWSASLGLEPFRSDVRLARFHGIGRFPTVTIANERGKGIIMTGYRPYTVLRDAYLHARDELAHL